MHLNDKTQLKRMFDGLAKEIVHSAFHFRLHCDLRDAVDDHIYNQSPAFWGLTLSAHLATSLSYLLRAYDQHRNSLSLRGLLETIRNHTDWFRDEVDMKQLDSDLELVKRSDSDVSIVVEFRNKRFAHLDFQNTVNAALTNGIPLKTIESLSDRASSIVSRYNQLFDGNSWQRELFGADDFQRVLKRVGESN